ncbi:hypothetical protein MLD38_020276 [Melastoma candidum]|uniref:Uncharacterized protein n=1 Tax=Melastoma candidum TaxID=119954 RepID=A0ACB9QFF5_9MYRT|nr:hypothetical protein MLD38_020276 [Melastoma candidum]
MSFDDKDFDDAALWALMDSAASAASVSKPRKSCQTLTPVSHPSPQTLTFPSKPQRPNPSLSSSRSLPSNSYSSAYSDGGEVVQRDPQSSDYCYRTPPPPPIPPRKMARLGTPGDSESREVTPLSTARRSGSLLSVVSPEAYASPGIRIKEERAEGGMGIVRHSLAGRFPTVSLFKEYQNAAMEVCF